MTVSTARPSLIVFGGTTDGRSRRFEGHLAQVLQRRHNHDTFRLRYVGCDERPDLVERFRIEKIPTLLVVEEKRVRGRLAQPRGLREIESFLAPWLN